MSLFIGNPALQAKLNFPYSNKFLHKVERVLNMLLTHSAMTFSKLSAYINTETNIERSSKKISQI